MLVFGFWALLIATVAVLMLADDINTCTAKPFVDGQIRFAGGKVTKYEGESVPVTSPILEEGSSERAVIGSMAQMTEADALAVLKEAETAWSKGQGEWPQMSAAQRISALEKAVGMIRLRRDEIVTALVWEICKSVDDARAEFDRTMAFIEATIETFRAADALHSTTRAVNGILVRIRRAAIGIMLALGPFNYPFNETYATLIPALLMGNVVVMKVPAIGGLAHILTADAFAACLPAGVINFVTGSGRRTMGPLMASGAIDVLAFIGGSKAADALIKSHPNPHRLKIFLQLEGKNAGIVLPDADVATAAEQITVGALTYNGQRCTAVKLILVHESLAAALLPELVQRIERLVVGQPWTPSVKITPLPEPNKPAYLQELIADALAKGARIMNANGGTLVGSLMTPAVLYPVDKSMRLWHEEQFGPVVPVAVYRDVVELEQFYRDTPFGQQASVFTSSERSLGPVLDLLSTAVGRVNVNTQCGRSPDTVPFSGRRSSALGTMSVSEALNTFSIETVVAAKEGEGNAKILDNVSSHSKFMAPV